MSSDKSEMSFLAEYTKGINIELKAGAKFPESNMLTMSKI
jgi:hypothetical protein